MQELLTGAEMREIEARAIAGGAVTGLELMERAGQGVVDALLEMRPELGRRPGRALILCGPGNNGGDGFVIARLMSAHGWQVDLCLYGHAPTEIAKLPPDAAENARRWREIGDIYPLESAFIDALETPDLIVDALFGTGLTRPLAAPLSALLAKLAERIDGMKTICVAV